MPKLRHTENAFTILEALLILIIVAIIGGTSYFVYRANQKTTNTYTASAKTVTQADGGKGGSSTSPPKTEVFLIPEWKVSATIPTPPKTAALIQYKIVQESGQTWAYFSTQELLDADSDCTADSGAAGNITRALPTDPLYNIDGSLSGTTVQQAVDDGTLKGAHKAGGYYYWYGHPQAQCGTSSKVPVLQNAAETVVKSIVDNLTSE